MDTLRNIIISNFCDDECDIERIIGPIEKEPYKYADGTIKTKPMLRDYAFELVEQSHKRTLAAQQEQILALQEQILALQKISERVESDSESESEIAPLSESESESDSESDSESESESDYEIVSEIVYEIVSEIVSEIDSESELVELVESDSESELVESDSESESELVESEPANETALVIVTLNTRRCSRCRVQGHYRNNCPLLTCFPKKQTTTWNKSHIGASVTKYTCQCGKQEMNKSNLDRHIKNKHSNDIPN